MSADEFARRMRVIYPENSSDYDEEGAHIEADDLLTQALREAGYEAGVTIYEGASRWYA